MIEDIMVCAKIMVCVVQWWGTSPAGENVLVVQVIYIQTQANMI